MSDRYGTRNPGQTWRGYEDRGGWERQSEERWAGYSNDADNERQNARNQQRDQDWQPETDRGGWRDEVRRQRLSPGQTSYGGPAREDRDDEREFGHERFPDHPQRNQWQGDSRRHGSDLRYGLNGQYGSASDERGDAGRRNAGMGTGVSRDREWLRNTQSQREPWRQGTRPQYGNRYFNDIGQRHDFPQGRGDEWSDPEDEHGALYQMGRRIGEAVGGLFGSHDESPATARRVGPKGYQRSDERIRELICEHLAYAEGVDVSEVSVDVKAGVVTLTGSVRDRNQKFDIEDIADNVFGVTEVENQIRVNRGMSPEKMTDLKSWTPE